MFEWLLENTVVHGVSLFALVLVLLMIAVACGALVFFAVHPVALAVVLAPLVAWKIFKVYW